MVVNEITVGAVESELLLELSVEPSEVVVGSYQLHLPQFLSMRRALMQY